MKRCFLLAIALVLCWGGVARAACTPEDAQVKAQEFMNFAIALAQKDPQRYQAVAQAMRKELPELQKTDDVEKLCGFYDEWIAKMK